jgi:hypothetical protein|tara:strand:+ start:15750 stop:15983 length:234 start_codon:yes stop_codon:yes gene_type:complete
VQVINWPIIQCLERGIMTTLLHVWSVLRCVGGIDGPFGGVCVHGDLPAVLAFLRIFSCCGDQGWGLWNRDCWVGMEG